MVQKQNFLERLGDDCEDLSFSIERLTRLSYLGSDWRPFAKPAPSIASPMHGRSVPRARESGATEAWYSINGHDGSLRLYRVRKCGVGATPLAEELQPSRCGKHSYSASMQPDIQTGAETLAGISRY